MRNGKGERERDGAASHHFMLCVCVFCTVGFAQSIASTYLFLHNFPLDFPFFVPFDERSFSSSAISFRPFFFLFPTDSINIYWYRKYNRLPFMLFIYVGCLQTSTTGFVCCLLRCAPIFISFNWIQSPFEWATHGKWRMTMFIVFHLTTILLPRTLHPLHLLHHLLFYTSYSLIKRRLCATVGLFLFQFISFLQINFLPNAIACIIHWHFTFFFFQTEQRYCLSDVHRCGRTHTHTLVSLLVFLHFIFVHACFEITATHTGRDPSIRVWRMAEPSMESKSKLVFIFAAIETQQAHMARLGSAES